MRLNEKVAIVTGAGSGFGAGIAGRFAREGARVVVNDIDEDSAAGTVAAIRDAGNQAVALCGDVSSAGDMRRLVASVCERFGKLDIMVNNAGVTHRNQPMLDVDEEMFDRIFAVNVKACYLAAREIVPVFRRNGGGVILNIGSAAGMRPRPGLTWYSASKGALISMTKAMAVELASDSIRVIALCPAAGDTPLLPMFLPGGTPVDGKAFLNSIPLGRLTTPTDVADAALFMVSDEASFITGAVLEVDGGRCI